MAAYSGGFYRTNDSISNLRIRVRLEKRSSTSFGSVPGPSGVRSAPEDPQNGMEMRDFTVPESTGTEPVIETDEHTFSWQEKILSKNEFMLYSDENNCHNPQQTKYHDMVKKFKNKNKPTKWLFTYVDGDEIPNKQPTIIGKDDQKMKTVLESNMETLRRRKSSLKPSWNQEGVRDFSHVNVVNQSPTETQRKLWHNVTTPFQTMHVMAELQSDNGVEEVVLCTIKADERGVVYVQPDFRQKPYELEIRDLGKEVYLYTIELASRAINDEERQRERTIQKELYLRRATQLSSLVGHDFETVPMDTFRLHLFGEIVSAQNFEYDNLYVNFCLEVPQNWVFEGGDHPVYGTTQTSKAKTVDGTQEISYFGHTFAYLMSCKTDQIFQNESLVKWPQLLIQVMSRDVWNRFRTEGYGYVTIPSQSGYHTLNVSTWRPLTPNTLSDQLRRFFIGGSPELEDLTDVAVTSTHEDKVLSKYGFRTVTTGTVTIRFQTVHQSEPSSTLQTSVEAVLEAFHRARHRMLAARENLNF